MNYQFKTFVMNGDPDQSYAVPTGVACEVEKTMLAKRLILVAFALVGGLWAGNPVLAQTALDVFESPDLVVPFGQITTIATAQTGAEHYNFGAVGPSGTPTDVNLGPTNANVWVHENTNTGEFTFGLIFGEAILGAFNRVSFDIQVFGSLNDPFISQLDCPGEGGCTAAASSGALDLTSCRFVYGSNTDGIAISGITGDSWTIIVTPIQPFFFGVITDWFAAGGVLPDLTLTLGNEYVIRPGEPATGVEIDIKPGSDPNGVNPRSKGVIPVAVLGSVDFDAMQVDSSTVKFGPDRATPVHEGHVEDVNSDGFDDFVVHFNVSETGIDCGDIKATLTGNTSSSGVGPFTGTDAVKTVGCKQKTSAQELFATTNQGELVAIDLAGGTATLIGDAGMFNGKNIGWTGLSFDAAGDLFAVSRFRSEPSTGCTVSSFANSCAHLYQLDSTNGVVIAEIGNTQAPWISDIDFASGGTLYGNQWDGQGTLVTINPGTAIANIVDHFGNSPFSFDVLQNGGLSTHPKTGEIWAVESSFRATDVLIFKVDPSTGAAIPPIVQLGLLGTALDRSFGGFDALEILPKGRFIATRGAGSSEVYEINPIPDAISGLAEITLIPLVLDAGITGSLNGLECKPSPGKSGKGCE